MLLHFSGQVQAVIWLAQHSPYELLSSSLATCASITMRMYANRKGWPLQRVAVEVKHGKIHAEDCADCETKEGKIDSFEKVVRIEGNLDEEQVRRLLEIADRCPVHRTLQGEIRIVTRVG